MRAVGPRAFALRGALLLACWTHGAAAEERTPRVHAFVNARVVVKPGTVLERATVVVRDGIIAAVGTRVTPPADARLWDARGRTLYPGLIEACLDLTPPKKPAGEPRARGVAAAPAAAPAETEKRGATHDNPRVHPEASIAETLQLSADDLDNLRGLGFTVAHVVPGSGVFRGQSALVSLRDGSADMQVMRVRVAQIVAFERGGEDEGASRRGTAAGYPGSLMGSVALVRQTLLDAGWSQQSASIYAAASRGVERPASNLSLQALAPALSHSARQPVWMATEDLLGALRCTALAREFGLDATLIGSGEEYRRLDAVRQSGLPLVLPVHFPDAPRAEDADEALGIDLEELRHWQAAPDNPRRLHEAGVRFALTSVGLEKRSDFPARVRTAIERGLPRDVALAALTTVPAQMLGAAGQLGSIEPGKIADLTVTDGDLFAEETHCLEVWVDGDRYPVRDGKRDAVERVRGDWKLVSRGEAGTAPRSWKLQVTGAEPWSVEASLEGDSDTQPLRDVRWSQGELTGTRGTPAATLRLRPSGKVLRGVWVSPEGRETAVEGSRVEGVKPKDGAEAPKGGAR